MLSEENKVVFEIVYRKLMEMQAVSTLETHLIESCHEEGGHCLKQARCVAFGLVMLSACWGQSNKHVKGCSFLTSNQ